MSKPLSHSVSDVQDCVGTLVEVKRVRKTGSFWAVGSLGWLLEGGLPPWTKEGQGSSQSCGYGAGPWESLRRGFGFPFKLPISFHKLVRGTRIHVHCPNQSGRAIFVPEFQIQVVGWS